MIGPAEIEDMMSEYADAQPTSDEVRSSEPQKWPPSSWSWGSGPTAVVTREPDPQEPAA